MTLCTLFKVILPDTCALNPINMPQLHMTTPDWKSDIGLFNLDNIQSKAARQPLPVVNDISTGIGTRIRIAQYGAECVDFQKYFTDLSWLILGCFLRLFLVTFLLCWTATVGSDSWDGTERRDDMQQRSRSGDMSRTSTNCQHAPFMLISRLKLTDILHCYFLSNFLFCLISIFLFHEPVSASDLWFSLPFTKQKETKEQSFTLCLDDNNYTYKANKFSVAHTATEIFVINSTAWVLKRTTLWNHRRSI